MNDLSLIKSCHLQEVTNIIVCFEMAIWALLGIVKENSQRVGLLLGSLPEGNLHIIAAWPDSFADQLRADDSLLDVVLDSFVRNPPFWKQVDLIVGFH